MPDQEDVSNEDLATIGRLVVLMYDRVSSFSSVNECRHVLFSTSRDLCCKHSKFYKQAKQVCSQCKHSTFQVKKNH